MIPRLKALLNGNNGNESALLMSPQTLMDILTELENMCVTSDEIECRPCDAGRPGFWMKFRQGAAAVNPYNMRWDLVYTGIYNDSWTPSGGQVGTDATAGNFAGVLWNGPRVMLTSTTGSYNEFTLYTRGQTFDAFGKLVAVSAEYSAGLFQIPI